MCSDSALCSFLTIDNLAFSQSAGVYANAEISCAISPNPASRWIWIMVDQQSLPYQLSIINVMGQVTSSEIVNEQRHRIELGMLHAGIYSVLLKDQQGRSSIKKLVRQ